MGDLSLSDLGYIAEVIAALAVFISLIYLAIQIRQNTNVVRASSYQAVASGVSNFQSILAQNQSLARIYNQGILDLKNLAPDETLRFEMLLGKLFADFDAAVYLYERRMIDNRAMSPYTRFIWTLLEMPGISDWWQRSQNFFSEPMRNHLKDRKIL